MEYLALIYADEEGWGTLSPEDFAYLRAGFFPETAKRYEELLKGLHDMDASLAPRGDMPAETPARVAETAAAS